ncbi:hypothetical protein NQ318_016060 [Aromia moschata]|uniref:SH3 domain-containing protein n=1 Tax=Aromia moschata TaxID=1265417 RepID=A0AAV8XS59_9CUCU|nr:hypothetical protein NQ318_016060 [Aromia moschata]
MGDYALYQAIKSFKPSLEDELEFQKGDVFQISVESPFATSQTRRPGWLFAYNRRTRAVGYVQVECVKLLGSGWQNNTSPISLWCGSLKQQTG